MAKALHLVCAYLFVLVVQQVYSVPTGDGAENLFDVLIKRIETLEVNDAENKRKQSENEIEIYMLKEKMEKMESDFKLREEMLLKKIEKQELLPLDPNARNDIMDQISSQKNGIQKHRSTFRKDRGVPESETAFYATHTVWGNHHLGVNQVIPFELAITNVGNGFNNVTSTFIAPVDGTYVFHATVMGIDTHSSAHMRAHFDVDGTPYSVFWVTAFDQSSQMLIINLTTGQNVSLRNDHSDEGYIGTHHSTFSGFLLYQHSFSNAVVGK
ncbi:Complement C1q-like protein 4 [Mactra antiquata]